MRSKALLCTILSEVSRTEVHIVADAWPPDPRGRGQGHAGRRIHRFKMNESIDNLLQVSFPTY